MASTARAENKSTINFTVKQEIFIIVTNQVLKANFHITTKVEIYLLVAFG